MAEIVYFKGEDFDEGEGDEVGPITVVDEDTGAVRRDHGWNTRTFAKSLAADLNIRVELDGMSDDELEAFKKLNGYG